MRKLLYLLLPIVALACSGSEDKPGDGGQDDPVIETPVQEEPDAVCVDAPVVLTLASAPVLGDSGKICIFDSSDKLVDEIDLADMANASVRKDGQMIPAEQLTKESKFHTFLDAVKCANRWRIIHYTPLRIDGKKLLIRPHSGVLDFGKEYYVTIDKGVIVSHDGLKKGDLSIKTKAKPASKSQLKVSAAGDADFCTLQGAVSYAASLGKSAEVSISVADGVYEETVFIRDKNNLTIKGASRAGSVIAYANNESYANGSGASSSARPTVGNAIGACGGRGVILVESCDNLTIENLTLKNTFGEEKGQAEVIYFNNDNGHLTIENCSLHSLQDTFLCKGWVYVHNSLVSGGCDFIWGYPKACLFEDCEIRADAVGYIVQARVNNASDKGFVFLNCKLTAAEGVKNGAMYLARSGGSKDYYDNVTYVNCVMAPVISGTGWYASPAPNPSSASATSGWKEYGSKDLSGKAISSHSHCKYLSDAEASAFSSKAAVLGN